MPVGAAAAAGSGTGAVEVPLPKSIDAKDALLSGGTVWYDESSRRLRVFRPTPGAAAIRNYIEAHANNGQRCTLTYTPDLKESKWVVSLPTDADRLNMQPGNHNIINWGAVHAEQITDVKMRYVANGLAYGLAMPSGPESDGRWVVHVAATELEQHEDFLASCGISYQKLSSLLALDPTLTKLGGAVDRVKCAMRIAERTVGHVPALLKVELARADAEFTAETKRVVEDVLSGKLSAGSDPFAVE